MAVREAVVQAKEVGGTPSWYKEKGSVRECCVGSCWSGAC